MRSAIDAPVEESTAGPWWREPGLLGLDPDVERLFAEVDAVLRDVARPRPQRPHESSSRRSCPAPDRNRPRGAGRRPGPARACQRGPPNRVRPVGN